MNIIVQEMNYERGKALLVVNSFPMKSQRTIHVNRSFISIARENEGRTMTAETQVENEERHKQLTTERRTTSQGQREAIQ